ENIATQHRERSCWGKAGRICHDTLAFKGLDIRSRPLTFQLRDRLALLLTLPSASIRGDASPARHSLWSRLPSLAWRSQLKRFHRSNQILSTSFCEAYPDRGCRVVRVR